MQQTSPKVAAVVVGAIFLSACGGGDRLAPRTAYADGPIRSACLGTDRMAANDRLCGCVQAVADATLNGSERRRAAAFFRNPHQAQVVRQSDRPGDEVFWQRYKSFVAATERRCA